MSAMKNLYLAAAPPDTVAASGFGLPLAHMAFSVGPELKLIRGQIGTFMRGGLMIIHDRSYDRSHGDPVQLCQDILRECKIRDFTGVILDFEQPVRRILEETVAELSRMLTRAGLTMTVSRKYAHLASASVLLSSAVTSGTLKNHWEELSEQEKRPLAVEIDPLARDFILSQSRENGKSLSSAVLESLIQERRPTIFFSSELCAHYFTYKDEMKHTHFVLFDDTVSIARKIILANATGADPIVMLYPDVRGILHEILRYIV
jgi:hypothetical protein